MGISANDMEANKRHVKVLCCKRALQRNVSTVQGSDTRKDAIYSVASNPKMIFDQLQALSAQQLLANASGLALNANPIPMM